MPAHRSASPDEAGIIWPSSRVLIPLEHQGASPQERAQAYAERLVAANPQLIPWSVDGPHGVHLAARNARILLTHALGETFKDWMSDLRLTGRHHRYGSTMELEWTDWPSDKAPERSTLKAITGVFIPPNAIDVWNDLPKAAFRQAFGQATQVQLNSKTPSRSAIVQRERELLHHAIEAVVEPSSLPDRRAFPHRL